MSSKAKKVGNYRKIPLIRINPPKKADRIDILPEAVEELSDSIAEVGLLSPVLLSVVGDRFEIVFGHRRLLAVQGLGWSDIPALIVNYTPEQISIARATENLQREDLSPLEESRLYSRLVNDLQLTISEVANKMGKSPGVVKRRLEIVRMPQSFQRALHSGKISHGVAEELWSCADDAHREYLLELAVEHGITTAIARQWVQEHRKQQRPAAGDDEQGGQMPETILTEKIYRSCDACQGPVELSTLRELRMCPKCYGEIVQALQGEG